MVADPISLNNPIPHTSDFTDYRDDNPRLIKQLQELSRTMDGNSLAYDCDAKIVSSQEKDKEPKKPSRVHACRCFKGKHWSLTIRQETEEWMAKFPSCPSAEERKRTNFAAKSNLDPDFLNTMAEVCDTLYPLIFKPSEKKESASGLVVVTGGTGCGKSKVIRGLIDRYLCDQDNLIRWFNRKRLPHLVTYEDPIEQFLFDEDRPSLRSNAAWINYTPRQREVDVSNLRSAIKSALRQTPAAFYVGEVRDIWEWKSLLEFAGTGHLIFTTAHAGSLVEAMGKLFDATSSDTAGRRAIVADRLVALVHLRPDQINIYGLSGGGPTNIVIPSMWRRTMVGAKTLMAAGQSSLLPHCGSADKCDEDPDQSCFGRAHFGTRLIKCAQARTNPNGGTPLLVESFAELQQRCTEWDLEGL